MAGNLKTNSIQLGDSATPTQNFTLRTNIDGTATLARGNVGATTQDILTIGADGTVKLPASVVPAFSAYASANQTITSSTYTKVQLNAEEFDTASVFDATTNYRFTPNVAGYYQITGKIDSSPSTSPTRVISSIYKNGFEFRRLSDSTGNFGYSGGVLVYMNGTTDYLELFGYITATTAVISLGSIYTYFQGILIART